MYYVSRTDSIDLKEIGDRKGTFHTLSFAKDFAYALAQKHAKKEKKKVAFGVFDEKGCVYVCEVDPEEANAGKTIDQIVEEAIKKCKREGEAEIVFASFEKAKSEETRNRLEQWGFLNDKEANKAYLNMLDGVSIFLTVKGFFFSHQENEGHVFEWINKHGLELSFEESADWSSQLENLFYCRISEYLIPLEGERFLNFLEIEEIRDRVYAELNTIPYRVRCASTLEELCDALNVSQEECEDSLYKLEDRIDLTSLQCFGDEPVSLADVSGGGIYSWDDRRILVYRDRWEIEDREDR